MTPEQLLQLRKSRGLTREELAAELGGCSAPAIVKWERGERAIPAWVEEKMLRSVPLTLPIEDLQKILEHCRETGQDIGQVLAKALLEYVRGQKKH